MAVKSTCAEDTVVTLLQRRTLILVFSRRKASYEVKSNTVLIYNELTYKPLYAFRVLKK